MNYNGYTSRATLCVHLWLSNDEATYNVCRALAVESRTQAKECWHVKNGCWPAEDSAKFLLSEKLRELVEEGNPLSDTPSVYADLLSSALSDVDWHEVAAAFLED